MRNREQRLQRSRRIGLEVLEDRTLLAGDVTAEVVDGSLLIHGDELDNLIAIRPGPEPGEFVVAGRADASGVPTTVNGGESFLAVGVTGNVGVRMGHGNDTVAVVRRGPATDAALDTPPIRLPGNVGIGMGPGADTVLFRHADVHGNLSISGGTGRDEVRLHDVHVGEHLSVALGHGKDSIAVGQSRVAGDMDIAGGRRADTIRVENVGVRGSVSIRAGRGHDSVAVIDSNVERSLAISARAGNNDITVRGTDVHGRVSFRTGSGNDSIRGGQFEAATPVDSAVDADHATWGSATIYDSGGANDIVLRDLTLSRGGFELRTEGRGDDTIRLRDVDVHGQTRIATGGDEDHLAIVDSIFGSRFILHMGSGNDTARVARSTFAGPTIMLGGSGHDRLRESHNTFLGVFFENFER